MKSVPRPEPIFVLVADLVIADAGVKVGELAAAISCDLLTPGENSGITPS